MRRAGPLLCLAASIAPLGAQATERTRPKGVGPEFAKFYKSQETFTCISNPSVKIPFSQVNDDFCDCPDGSDEPGTAACAYLSILSPSSPADTGAADKINSTLALPGFYCKNKGHIPGYVPFTIVNDGICDYDVCCDGGDEWQGTTKCEDRCAKIGAEARKASEARQRSLNTAKKRRRDLVAEAARLRKEVEEQIVNLQTQIEAAEVKVEAAKETLKETEKREKGKVVRGAAGGNNGEVAVLVGQAKQRTQELREHLIRVRQERDSSKSRLAELEALLRTFKEEYNPNFNDEGVKRAVRAWEDYAARDTGGQAPEPEAALDRDLDEITKTDEEAGIDWESFATSGTSENPELELLYSFEAYLPSFVREWVDDQLRNLRRTLVENGILANTGDDASSSVSESKAVTAARTALSTAESDASGLRSQLDSHKADLGKDYGADGVFRALANRCVETDSGEYTYEACFLGATTQKAKKGGGHTNMGHFTGFDELDFDEPTPPDGKGVGTGRRLAMKYENGQHCWNGPNRSTTVVLVCAETDELWKITEEEKCVYRMIVGTSAVCGHGEDRAEPVAQAARDEL